MDEEEDDVPTCPLCLEELDATDRAVKACQCGYQLCLWCLHHIREQHSARCPACRTPYEEQNFKFAEVNPEQAAKEAKERATAKKEKERRDKLKEIEKERARAVAVSQQKAKNNLKHARILQRNLVYVIGLSLTLAREEVIRRADMFGKFGRMLRILVNRSHPFNADAPGGPSISAYVQYYRDSDASAAVRAMNNAVFDGREIRCAVATTKYCDVFVKSANSSDPTAAHHCGNQFCMYYHSISPEPVMTREEVLARQLGPPPPAHLFVVEPRRPHLSSVNFHRPGLATSSLPSTSNHSSAAPSTAASSAAHSRSVATRAQPPPNLPPSSLVHAPLHTVTNSNPVPIQPISIPTNATSPSNAAVYHQSLASSPRLRSNSVPNTARKIVPAPPSSSASPQGTPPSSPPAPRRSVPRLNRSPISHATGAAPIAPSALAGSANGAVSSAASSSSFYSPNGTQLPSSAGWASTHASRTSSRSPPRRGPVASVDESARGRPRMQILRPRESAPPGFEDSSLSNVPAMPSRPPGFGTPTATVAKRTSPVKSNVARAHALSTGAPPPGFGPGPASTRPATNEESMLTDVAVAWAQEASTDEVFSSNERKPRSAVGQPGQRVAPGPQGDIDARSDLAQVLAKIGGHYGVSSEFQNVKMPGVPEKPVAGAVGGGSSGQPALSSLFGTPAFQPTFAASVPPNSFLRDQHSQTPQTSVNDSSFTAPFGRGGGSSLRKEVLKSKRNNSRFGFARKEASDRRIDNAPAAVSIPPRPSVPPMEEGVPIRMISKFETLAIPNGSSIRAETDVGSEVTRGASKPHTVAAAPQTPRQSRSRFGFADRAASPPKAQHLTSAAFNNPVVQTNGAVVADPVSDAFGAGFANLSTAEKLASIFNSAQCSAGKLPPMPVYGAETEPVPNQHDPPVIVSTANLVASRPREDLSGKLAAPFRTEDARPTSHLAARPAQFAPPGFREATPGISPESTAVDQTLTSSGVATNVVSGGTNGNGDKMTSSQLDESLSSGTESLEEDRKRSRAQRKRDKKARQLREAAERKDTTETRVPRPSLACVPSEEVPAKVMDHQTELAQGGELCEIKHQTPGQILVKPKESSKQLKPAKLSEDPGRFMSVLELEREVEAARVREAQLQDRLQELQRRIRSYDNVRT